MFQTALQLSQTTSLQSHHTKSSGFSLSSRPSGTEGEVTPTGLEVAGGFVSARHLVADAATKPLQKSKLQQQTLSQWSTTDRYKSSVVPGSHGNDVIEIDNDNDDGDGSGRDDSSRATLASGDDTSPARRPQVGSRNNSYTIINTRAKSDT